MHKVDWCSCTRKTALVIFPTIIATTEQVLGCNIDRFIVTPVQS